MEDNLYQLRKWQKQFAAERCNEAILSAYDTYAQENISNFRLNLSTGLPYTIQDKEEMDAFIDSKRQQYAQKKSLIDSAVTENDIYSVPMLYE